MVSSRIPCGELTADVSVVLLALQVEFAALKRRHNEGTAP